MATPKHDIRFTFKVENKHDITGRTFELIAHVVYLVRPDRPNDSGIRNPSGCDFFEGLVPLADLQIHAYGRDDVQDPWYGWSLEYRNVFSVDLRRSEAMTKALRKYQRTFDKLDAQLGRPEDLAAFAGRCAVAVGATHPTPFGQWHDEVTINGTHYRWLDVDGLRSVLARARQNVTA